MQDLTAQAEAAAAAPISAQEAPQTKAAQLDPARAELQTLQARYKARSSAESPAAKRVAQLEREAAEEAAGSTALGPQVVANPIACPPSQGPRRRARWNSKASTARSREYDAEQRKLRGQIAEYQRRMELAPLRDSELVELTRDYATYQTSV